MRKDLTDITLVVDRSGSMSSVKSDAEGGINQFIADQKAQPGEALLTLVQFDTEYEFIHNGVSIRDAAEYRLQPRGQTALLDAVGRAIIGTGSRLEEMAEKDRPACVVFVIVTDGHENSSREFTKAKVREMIEHQRTAYNWQFTFLGADDSAFDEAAAIGIHRDAVASYNPQRKSGEAYKAASSNVARMRLATSRGESVQNAYTDQERKSLKS